MHGATRGHIDSRDGHIISGVAKNLRRGIRVLRAHVRQQHVLAHTNSACNCLTDLTRSDDDNDLTHEYSGLRR